MIGNKFKSGVARGKAGDDTVITPLAIEDTDYYVTDYTITSPTVGTVTILVRWSDWEEWIAGTKKPIFGYVQALDLFMGELEMEKGEQK